jgi:hypothetical protein
MGPYFFRRWHFGYGNSRLEELEKMSRFTLKRFEEPGAEARADNDDEPSSSLHLLPWSWPEYTSNKSLQRLKSNKLVPSILRTTVETVTLEALEALTSHARLEGILQN